MQFLAHLNDNYNKNYKINKSSERKKNIIERLPHLQIQKCEISTVCKNYHIQRCKVLQEYIVKKVKKYKTEIF